MIVNGREYTATIYRTRSRRPIVEYWELHGAGHAWSGGSSNGSFTDESGPDASAEMVRFFLSQGAKD
jgi:poly(3-hydroxybutyrate) depolymerase